MEMNPCVSLPLDHQTLVDLVEKAKDYLLMHGICMRQKSAFDRDALHFAPFLLFPSPFPKREFELGMDLQCTLQLLMHKVAHDYEFLRETLEETIKVDQFTKRLFDIYEMTRKEGLAQKFTLGLLRSDYFFCCDSCTCKQVEFNTIASSMSGVSAKMSLAHKYVLGEYGRKDLAAQIPENNALQGLCEGMLEAWKIYDSPKAVILFVIEDVTYNICDQKFHEFEIRRQNPDVFVVRKTLTEVAEQGVLDEVTKRLKVNGEEVAVVYFRCGYSPDQYPSEKEWEGRVMIERSLAIKSPTVHYHLAGTKKVQQRLAEKGMLEKFLPGKDNAEAVEKIRGIFTGLYELDEKSIANARKDPSRYVIKPQREGGGNNIYGDDIVPFLDAVVGTAEQNAYIVMDRISPPVTTNYMVRPLSPKDGPPATLVKTISELGIFGYLIGGDEDEDKTVVANKAVGYCLRTKLSHVNEGGVAAGLGALDSPYLVDMDRCCSEKTNCCDCN